MKRTFLLGALTALGLGLGLSSPAFAVEYSKGEIVKIDEKAKKITIKHGELKNLEMPAMTMVFAVADDSMVEKAKVGQKVEFVAERMKGKLTVVEMK